MPRSGRRLPAAAWLFANARPNVRSIPITSPVERISGPSTVSTVGKRSNGSTASFTATCPPAAGSGNTPVSRSSASVAPTMSRAATLASGTPVALLTNGTVRLARGFASMIQTWPSLHRVLHVEQTDDVERVGERARVRLDRREHVGGERRRRDRARGVAGVHACFLDVLHDPADEHVTGAVAQRVDVDLDRVLEEAVDERRPFRGEAALAAEAAGGRERRPSRGGARRRRRRSPSRGRRARTTAARAPGSRCPARPRPRRRGSRRRRRAAAGCSSSSHSSLKRSRSSARSIEAGLVPSTR